MVTLSPKRTNSFGQLASAKIIKLHDCVFLLHRGKRWVTMMFKVGYVQIDCHHGCFRVVIDHRSRNVFPFVRPPNYYVFLLRSCLSRLSFNLFGCFASSHNRLIVSSFVFLVIISPPLFPLFSYCFFIVLFFSFWAPLFITSLSISSSSGLDPFSFSPTFSSS